MHRPCTFTTRKMCDTAMPTTDKTSASTPTAVSIKKPPSPPTTLPFRSGRYLDINALPLSMFSCPRSSPPLRLACVTGGRTPQTSVRTPARPAPCRRRRKDNPTKVLLRFGHHRRRFPKQRCDSQRCTALCPKGLPYRHGYRLRFPAVLPRPPVLPLFTEATCLGTNFHPFRPY